MWLEAGSVSVAKPDRASRKADGDPVARQCLCGGHARRGFATTCRWPPSERAAPVLCGGRVQRGSPHALTPVPQVIAMRRGRREAGLGC